ncbi:Battenin [Brachionus plicatilis]|uniref:Battenin n=1 Tax=Brachionus plicatilis TaxID=10195 RepID=A0A3M7QZZ7_BRAPC|nr:Battenin [Brachionus plicatilis]
MNMKRLEHYWEKYYPQFVITSYWLLGLTNNFAYVIMLSAAHDILSDGNSNSTDLPKHNTTNRFDCNELSTGAILLADILPGIAIKLVAPFFVHKIKYWKRVVVVIITNSCSFLLVSLTPSNLKPLIFLGVMAASFSSSFGEITFLSMSTLYIRTLSITGWASGTGAAGLIGSFGYAALTSIGLTPSTTILLMMFIPVLMALSYVALPTVDFAKSRVYSELDTDSEERDTNEPNVENNLGSVNHGSLRDKFKLLPPLLKFMIPLFLVYFAEYFINQGLFELLYFKNAFIKQHKLQYRWYNVMYQLAVFVSRSSVKWIKIKFLPIFPILQILNIFIFLSHIYLDYFPSIWIVFLLIFWEGLLGGGCYVNSFNQISIEIPKNVREFSIAVASIADSFGIALAGFIAIPVHNSICSYGNK